MKVTDKMIKCSLNAKLLCASSVICLMQVAAIPAQAQNCQIVDDTLVDIVDGDTVRDCVHTNDGTGVSVPAEPNQEFESLPDLNSDGFELSVDGNPVTEEGRIVENQRVDSAVQRIQDLNLNAENISVKFDGLDVRPRLDARIDLDQSSFPSGNLVTIYNETNYPAFITRGEIRIFDTSSSKRGRVVQTINLDPNDTATFSVPDNAENLVYVYRVYDARGRYDETVPTALGPDTRRTEAPADIELGTDATAIRRIPVDGGSVTVSGHSLPVGTSVSALGTTTRASREGKFVIQRILPDGWHAVDVVVANRPVLTRDVEVKNHDIFYVGIADLTIGKSLENELLDATGEPYDDTYVKGRAALYLKGKIRGQYLLTAAFDTGEEDIKDILRKFDDKTAGGLLDRIDPDEYYPVYGDDSTSENDAPTSGKLYVKLEKNNSFILWGDYESKIEETEYLRNQRTLYGAQGHYETQQTTSRGDARAVVQAYAASPDTLPAKDRLLGTGGSSYFLKNNDITVGSETVEVEVINTDTGEVVSRRTLIFGVDYDINYLQGLILLRAPLSGGENSGDLITTGTNGDLQTQLVVGYQYTPGATSVDGYSYGGRVQGWLTDNIRVGATGHSEEKGTTDLQVYGADILLKATDQTYLELEYAESEGSGFIESISADGGLTYTTTAATTGSGKAYRAKASASLQDLGAGIDGVLTGYYENIDAGFASLTTQSSVDLTRWGLTAEVDVNETTSVRLDYDDYSDSVGKEVREASAQIEFAINQQLSVELGAEQYEILTPGDPANTGDRTDVAARLTYAPNGDQSYYVFGQYTADISGGLARNDRYGAGLDVKLNNNWSVSGEISDGTTGLGARLLATYDRDENSSYYFGYTLDNERDVGGQSLSGRDKGKYVIGAKTRVNEDWSLFAENTYDLFGEHKSLTSVYGATYEHSDYLTLTGGIEVGNVKNTATNTEFDRTALSLGATYKDEKLSVSGRLEYRKDADIGAAGFNTGTTIAASLTSRYKIDDEQRLLFSFDGVKSDGQLGTVPDAEFAEVVFGYAYRPIDNDRLNVLAKYRYVHDTTSRTTTAVGTDANFTSTPRQYSHIFSVDGSYDLNNHWTIGGKIGGRFTSQDSGSGFVDNNAWLGVLNLRYHVVHEWDALIEFRQLEAEDLGTDTGILAAVYRHVGNNAKIGIGYNFGQFSDDLADLTYDDQGLFINIIGKF